MTTKVEDQCAANTNRELWREPGNADGAGSYYMPSIHVTEQGIVCINVGGYVIGHTLEEWHTLAVADLTMRPRQFALLPRVLRVLSKTKAPRFRGAS